MANNLATQLRDIPVLPLRNRVLLPGSPLRLSIGKPTSINLVNAIWKNKNIKFVSNNTLIVIVTRKPTADSSADPNPASTPSIASLTDNLYDYGTIAKVTQLQTITSSNATYSMIVTGVGRVRIENYLTKTPYLRARVALMRDVGEPDSPTIRTLTTKILALAQEILGATKATRNGSPIKLSSLGSTKQFLEGLKRLAPGTLADLLVSTLKLAVPEKQNILETIVLEKRLQTALLLLEKQNEMIKVNKQITAKVTNKLKLSQREYYLREQLKAIEEELGSMSSSSSSGGRQSNSNKEENVLETLKRKLQDLNLSKEGRDTVDREIARAAKMNPAQPEHSIIINYLQWMSELPWNSMTVDSISIDAVQAQLDDDHYGLQKVKTRLVEFLAVKQLHERLQRISAITEGLNAEKVHQEEEDGTTATTVPVADKPDEINDADEETRSTTDSAAAAAAAAAAAQTVLSKLKQRKQRKGPSTILCLVGPPGVGKTSLGTSVATALGRSFYRMALGGVHDEAELRGHRKTYIGAMPGNIIQGLKKAGTSNPVFLLDEIDKMGRDQRGDPTAALLEVLDPAQNHSFVDHYLNVPFDLSEVLFIATANNIETIPPPLRDRMEIIQLPGYTLNEKMKISKRHLISKSIEKHGLKQTMVDMPDASLRAVITGYTREAGVRTLERQISAICRRIAVMVAKQLPPLKAMQNNNNNNISVDEDHADNSAALSVLNNMKPTVVDEAFIIDVLGPNMYESEAKLRVTKPGVATGMAWTQVGGELLFIEATQMPGNGRLQITGNVKEVMRESCQASMSWLKSNAGTVFASMFEAKKEGVEPEEQEEQEEGEGGRERADRTLAARQVATKVMNHRIFQNKDIHIHFPAGAVPKDGPSAGCAITAALTSLWLDRNVRSDTSMTGEISLRGSVLPVGGVKSKVLAAHREGIRRVVLPKRNDKDIRDIPLDVFGDMEIIFVNNIEEMLDAVLEGGLNGHQQHPRDRLPYDAAATTQDQATITTPASALLSNL